MARNAEKAMTTLARWRQTQLEGDKGKRRRPYLASECNDLKEAERWRLEIIREISRKVTQIQNAGLGEYRVRDLNDQINKLLREKRHWEYRCAELGGVNYRRAPGPKFDFSGREVPGTRGYRYFGAAKDLPGVRELFSTEPPPLIRKTRAELMKDIDADYYGYRDEDDGVIVPLENEAQREAITKAVAGYADSDQQIEVDLSADIEDVKLDDDNDGIDFCGPKIFVSHVPHIASLEEIQEAILEKKKQELLEKFLSGKVNADNDDDDDEEDDE
ncbi:pre-mRNA-splicing factor ISY1 homolog [Panonychus citri]|uniref:pre-mRNA-splicing factor ISY1 homolog n=1 Tax=Panonychus citri TaxID=50023 RepID=UPI002307ED6F|nr:pre-mRNA-splicing factor ISY1 homolog [Panonychus citri]